MKSEHRADGIYIFSPFLRLFHWLMAASVLILFLTGRYIGNPSFIGSVGVEANFAVGNLLSMETIRFWHFFWAYVLIASFILRIYGWIRYKGDRLLPKFWTPLYWQGMVQVLQHYLFLRTDHPPFLRNSLARTTYLVWYLVTFALIATGLAMYGMIHPTSWTAKVFGPLITLLGNEYNVHVVHNYLAWFFPIFLTLHTYFAYRADMMHGDGEISSIFSGIKYLPGKPADIEDLK
jgi:Ni/Fe-hydrogenase 1 B-type cytochrome subunit